MNYFGRRWDAPAFDDGEQVPTPVGSVCLFCTDLVDDGDDGVLTTHLAAGGRTGLAAVHLECYLRMVLGSAVHLARRCSCFGGDELDDLASRDSGRATMTWLLDHHIGHFAVD